MDYTQNILSLCTGYGGIELGLRLAGERMRTIAACEVETFAIANLVAKMEEGALESFPIWTNLKTFDGVPLAGKIHGITGGYPCQPFSCAGKRKGKDDPRHLWPFIREHISTIRPLWCFFENVSGHLSMGFEEVFRDLQTLGYSVEAGMFSAAEVGAPHQRKRLFILAHTMCIGRGGRSENMGLDTGRPSPKDKVERPCTPSEELANPQGNNEQRRGLRQGEGKSGGSSTQPKELGDTSSLGLCRRQENRPKQPSEMPRQRYEDVADSDSEGVQGSEITRHIEEMRKKRLQLIIRQSSWPSRPGKPQHIWETTRTIEPSMGRAINGTTIRVDQLRLLGNGVVPLTAALAWQTLWEQARG